MASTQSPRRLAGRVALVTGAAGDIGAAIAARFALEGAKVVCTDIDLEGARRSAGAAAAEAPGVAAAIRCDVADAESAAAAVREAVHRYGRLDILVNNAAAPTPIALLHELDEKDWQRSLDVNLTGAFLMSKAALPAMLRARSGCIIHVASQMGHVGAPGRGAYGATKAALIQLARIMALDYGPKGIRVNSLSPGAVLTSRLTARYGSPAAVREALEPKYPLGRIGEAHEVALAAAFLASDDAAFMTGADLLIDGGYTAQ